MPAETPEVWSPERLAEAGIEVVAIRSEHRRLADAPAAHVLHDGASALWLDRHDNEPIGAFLRRAYAEATRLAKERQEATKPKVWWITNERQSTTQLVMCHPVDCGEPMIPGIITPDDRIVGVTPVPRRLALCKAASNMPLDGDDLLILQEWAAEIRNTNAAFAALKRPLTERIDDGT